MSAQILIIDDEAAIRNLLARILSFEDFTPVAASNGQVALKLLASQKFDLIILDLLMPGMSGEDLCRRIRQNAETRAIPVLVLTALNTSDIETKLLNMGADDFIGKPFERDTVLAHIRALLRRPSQYRADDDLLKTSRLTLHVGKRRVLVDGKPLDDMAPKEFELLKSIIQNAPNVIEKAVLAEKVWGVSLENLHYRTLDVHIQRVRKKLGAAASCLKTVPAVGYQWWESL